MNNVVFLKTAVVALTTSAYLGITSTAQAAIFTSKSAFLNATSGLTTVDFEGLTPPDTVASINNSTISGVTFSDTQSFTFVINCAAFPNNFSNCNTTIPLVGPTSIASTGTASNTITATLPAGITAVGVDLLPYSLNQDYTVSISTGETETITINNDVKFIGFTSTTPITSLSIFSTEGQVFDNLVYGQANGNPPPIGTPEPSIMLGLLTVSGIGFSQLKRTKEE
jgi:hypothetical protein